MPQPKRSKFESDIVLGDEYRDEMTGIKGIATAIYFFQHACERVCLERLDKDGEIKEVTFDAPRLIHVETEKQARTDRPGGPARETGVRRSEPVR